MVGMLLSFWDGLFSGRTVSFREGNIAKIHQFIEHLPLGHCCWGGTVKGVVCWGYNRGFLDSLEVVGKRKTVKHIIPNGGEKWWFLMVQSKNHLKRIQGFRLFFIQKQIVPTKNNSLWKHRCHFPVMQAYQLVVWRCFKRLTLLLKHLLVKWESNWEEHFRGKRLNAMRMEKPNLGHVKKAQKHPNTLSTLQKTEECHLQMGGTPPEK